MIKKAIGVFLLVLWAERLSAEPLLHYETFTLKNGLQFILMQNKRAPIVSYTTWYKVGSADEVPGKTGLAHYLEHLMETASPEIQMGQFLEDFNASGAHSNAYTARDVTFYYKMVMTDHLELLMRFEAGRMQGVAFNQDKFETEKNVIIEERLMRTENDPDSFFNEKFNNQFFTIHPYKNPIIGWEKDIRAITLDDVKAFHKKWYHPNNAFVIVSGDFDPAQVRAWAEKYYENIPSGPKITRTRPQEPLKKKKIAPILVEHPQTPTLSFSQMYPIPELKKQHYQDHLSLTLLSVFLSGDFKGSLEETLVHKEKLASTFHSQYALTDFLDPWSFSIVVHPLDESKIKDIENIINETLEKIAQNGLTQEDLNRTQLYIYNSWVMKLDDIFERAHFLGTAFSSGLTLEQINSLPQDLKKVTSADIQRVIQNYLTKDHAVMGILKKKSVPSPSEAKRS
ncbi:MAG: insulinase family protein [Alphaproteobacteria bacterium]|nr:insulinase family protein [Alphaproteobacteria bacterium]